MKRLITLISVCIGFVYITNAQRTVEYAFNTHGELISERLNDEYLIHTNYDEEGNIEYRSVIKLTKPELVLSVEYSICMFPNPTQNNVIITSETLNISKIEIYTLSGKHIVTKMCNQKTIHVNLSEYTTGLYYVYITIGEEQMSQLLWLKK